MSDYQVIVEYDKDGDETLAKNAMGALCEAYPGHPWHVNVASGVLTVKHMRLARNWAMVKHYQKIVHDAGVFKREIVMAAGELLERSGIARRSYDGSLARVIDGVPAKDVIRI